MAGSKVNVEPGDESMDEIGFAALKGERGLKGKIRFVDGVQVNLIHLAGVGHASLELNCVNKGLSQGGIF